MNTCHQLKQMDTKHEYEAEKKDNREAIPMCQSAYTGDSKNMTKEATKPTAPRPVQMTLTKLHNFTPTVIFCQIFYVYP